MIRVLPFLKDQTILSALYFVPFVSFVVRSNFLVAAV
jgi:hypothetical protein